MHKKESWILTIKCGNKFGISWPLSLLFEFKLKGALQSDLRMCTKEPTFYDTNSLTMFCVLEKPDCCFLIIYYTLELENINSCRIKLNILDTKM